jgi:hypothetical protein
MAGGLAVARRMETRQKHSLSSPEMPFSRNQKPADRTLHDHWLGAQVLRLRIRTLPGLTSYDAIASRISEVGRTIAAGGHNDPARSAIEDPPPGLIFPLDYAVNGKECAAALARATKRIPRLEPENDLKLIIERAEEILSRLRAGVINGNPVSIREARSMLTFLARLQDQGAPKNVESLRRDGRRGLAEMEDLSRWTEEDRAMMSALMNKLRGGPPLTIKTPGELRDEGSYALLAQLGFQTSSYKSS